MILLARRLELLAIARQALEARVRRLAHPVAPGDLGVPAAGVFVTVHVGGELRGCLGSLELREPLDEALIRLASAVAHDDARFAPLESHELAATTIEISVLTPPDPVSDVSVIEIGRDGLIVSRGSKQGLLLPQVAVEHGWTRETFLSQTCVKAGLSPDAWQTGAQVHRFRAEVFGDGAPMPSRP